MNILDKGLFCAVLLLALTACKRIETEPRDWIKEDLVWDEQDRNATVAGFFLNSVYSYIPNGFNRVDGDFLDAATDDALPSRINTQIEYYTNRRVSVLNNPDPYWGNSYSGIRAANIFLANIDKVPMADVTKRYWKAEARFIRSLMYFELLKRYGGVPLVGDKFFTIEDDLELSRNTFEECVNYITGECDAVKDSLRLESGANYGTSDWGRIAKGAAIALKCRTYLYAASPLFNGVDPLIVQDADKRKYVGYLSNDESRWQKVIDAFVELKALNYYSLQSSFSNVFLTNKNTEVILSKQSNTNFSLETNNAPVGFGTPAASFGRTSPTADLVDAFPMKNGLALEAAGSGYSSSNPYANRDPRLDYTVFYNGMQWLKRGVETFEGGLDKPGGSVVQTKTGYYLRKFMGNFATSTSYTNQSHSFILFRYAEMILNYAEALNEMNRTEEAVDQIKLLRQRAGITAGTNSRYGIAVGISKTDLRNLIRNERRIELAFEEHRFWDVRRWKIASTVLNGPVYGTRIIKNANNTLTYTKVQASNLVFDNKLYYMPVPYNEIIKNGNLLQNPGW